MSYLPCVEMGPGAEEPADGAIIWLHGLGANGHDFAGIVPELGLPAGLAIRFVFPHAPNLPVTINNGMTMPAWYDILEMDFDRRVDEAQLKQSANAVHALIDREVARGVPSDKIIVAGFSQGGAVGYEAALTYPKPLAGLLALSTYFATHRSTQLDSANTALAVLAMHGTMDPVVPEALGRKALEYIGERGLEAVYKTYPMQHSVCPEQIKDIGEWIRAKIA